MLYVFLDSGPLGLLANPNHSPEFVAIRRWTLDCFEAGIEILVPAIVYYELTRELKRANRTSGVSRLDAFVSAHSRRYLPLTGQALRLAADLWAQSRRQGRPTASPQSVDVDFLLAAQALTFGPPPSEIVIATTNRKHLAQFVDARATGPTSTPDAPTDTASSPGTTSFESIPPGIQLDLPQPRQIS